MEIIKTEWGKWNTRSPIYIWEQKLKDVKLALLSFSSPEREREYKIAALIPSRSNGRKNHKHRTSKK
jgi:hypothetical protein